MKMEKNRIFFHNCMDSPLINVWRLRISRRDRRCRGCGRSAFPRGHSADMPPGGGACGERARGSGIPRR